MPLNKDKLYIFCDEACINDKFMLYGGFICNFDTQCELQDELYSYKSNNDLKHEIKWNKCNFMLQDKYKGFVDIIFKYIASKKIAFKFMSIDTSHLDYKTYYNNNKELGFYTLYRMHLLHQFCVPYYNKSLNTKFYIRLDDRTTRYSLEDVKVNINSKLKYNKRMPIKTEPVINIEPRNSKNCIHIQLNDIILGAACFIKNNKFQNPTISEAKKNMANYIKLKSKIQFINNEESVGMSFWNFKMTVI